MRLFQASIEDVPRILECAREFCAILPDVPLDEAHYASEWREILATRGVIFLLEHEGRIAGGIGGVKQSDLLTGRQIAIELFWYVKPEHRGGFWSIRLLKAFERWAAEKACQHVAMIHTEASMPVELKSFYERCGYTHIESVYRKALKGEVEK